MHKCSELLKEQHKKSLEDTFEFKKLCQLLNKIPEERQVLFMSELEKKRLFISSREFSEACGIPEETARKWLRRGVIKGRRTGKYWLIPISELDRLTAEAQGNLQTK